MRKLVAFAALISFMPVANAAEKGEFTHNAEYRIRYQIDQAYTGDKDVDTTKHTAAHRFKLDTGFRSGEKFGAHLSLLHNSIFGDVAGGANGQLNQEKSAFDASNAIMVNQAYGTWQLNDTWSLKFGRGSFTLADGSTISQNDWEETPISFDGVLANWEHEMVRLSLFGVKAVDNVPVPAIVGNNSDPETHFFGFSAGIKSLPEFLKDATVYFTKVNGNETATSARRDEMRYGFMLSGDAGGVDYRGGFHMNTGEQFTTGGTPETVDVDGTMYQLEVGYNMPEMMKSRFYVGYHMDSGDGDAADDKNETYNPFFYERHCTSGCMDVLAWGNLTFLKAGYTFSPMDQVDVGLHYWKFERTEDADAANLGRNGAYTLAGPSDSTDIGQEIDLMATKKYDNGFQISAWVGMFMPGAYIDDTEGSDDTYNQVFLEGKMTF